MLIYKYLFPFPRRPLFFNSADNFEFSLCDVALKLHEIGKKGIRKRRGPDLNRDIPKETSLLVFSPFFFWEYPMFFGGYKHPNVLLGIQTLFLQEKGLFSRLAHYRIMRPRHKGAQRSPYQPSATTTEPCATTMANCVFPLCY